MCRLSQIPGKDSGTVTECSEMVTCTVDIIMEWISCDYSIIASLHPSREKQFHTYVSVLEVTADKLRLTSTGGTFYSSLHTS